ncbi:glycosyltransferase [Rheinheimera marina]|uniref:Glycosyltransferase n=1 Tax=Rheinheimera marina TaxID=1774958 RepID=A0ABV9JRI0_9GAMM
MGKLFFLRDLFRLKKFIRQHNIGLLVASSAHAGVMARLVKLLVPVQVYYVSHGWSFNYNGGLLRFAFRKIEQWLAALTDKIICISGSDYQIAQETLKVPQDKLVLIPNKVFKPTPSGAEPQVEKPDNTPHLLFLARLESPKRPELLNLLNHFSVSIDVIGQGSLSGHIHAAANIRLCGEVKNFGNFSAYDGLVLLSDSEGLPMSAIEAAACGLPLFLSDVGGCEELVRYQNGMVTSNDPIHLQENFSYFLNKLPYFSKQAEHASKYFDLNSDRKIWQELFGIAA